MNERRGFICSINERYIASMLINFHFSGVVAGRKGLDETVVRGAGNDIKFVAYSRSSYGFFSLAWFMRRWGIFDELWLACYDPWKIPLSFWALQCYGLFFAKRTLFVSPDGRRREVNRKDLWGILLERIPDRIAANWLFNRLMIQVLLIVKTPVTLWRLAAVFIPGGHTTGKGRFWAFSSRDAGFQSWYNKIARDFRNRGRFGYAWDDGLGMALGPRIYNNWATYLILSILGTRGMMGVGYAAMLAGTATLAIREFGILIGAAAVLLLAASPLLASLYTHMGKPEQFWHGLILVWVYLIFKASETGAPVLWLAVGLTWTLLAAVNVSAPVISGLMLVPAIIYFSWGPCLFWVTMGAAPGIIKMGLRFGQMIRDGFFSRMTVEQSRLKKEDKWFSREERRRLFPWIVAVAAAASTWSYTAGILLLVPAALVFWVNGENGRIIKLNDSINLDSMLGCAGLGFSLATGSLWALGGMLFFYYPPPVACGFPISTPRYKEAFSEYPALSPMAYPLPDDLGTFFNHIQDNSRILAEADGDPRTASPFRMFWQWSEDLLPKRGIDLVNEIYTTFVEPDLMEKYVSRFRPGGLSAHEIAFFCNEMGISYVISYGDAMKDTLQDAGFEEIARTHLGKCPDFTRLIISPPLELVLFKNSRETSVISPPVSWKIERNQLIWHGEAGRTYVIRYRYYSRFSAIQEEGKVVLKVEPYKPFADFPLTFMQVTVQRTGKAALYFRTYWL